MNTKFNILWFEDTDEWYLPMEETIREYIVSHNFTPNFVREKSSTIFDNALTKYSYDIIFVDLKLLNDTKGNEAIKAIRDNNILADILFYSNDRDKIMEAMRNEALEGVYISARNDVLFPKKAKDLIGKIVRRSEDILNVRGMLMDNVSEFDEKLKDVIRKYFAIYDGTDKIKIINDYAYKKVVEQFNSNLKECELLKTNNFLISALNETFLIDSYKLSSIVNKIFKLDYKQYSEMKDFHDNYASCILKERNKLAHAKKEPEADGIFYFEDENGKTEYNSQKCSEIRANINAYNELLLKIIEYIV